MTARAAQLGSQTGLPERTHGWGGQRRRLPRVLLGLPRPVASLREGTPRPVASLREVMPPARELAPGLAGRAGRSLLLFWEGVRRVSPCFLPGRALRPPLA